MLTNQKKNKWYYFAVCFFFASISIFGQTTVTLNADGPGNTYELIDSVFGGGASSEVPDNFPSCNNAHQRHIREGWDSTLNKYVFLFDVFIDTVIDYDRCANTDRQRVEIKTVASNIQGGEGALQVYKWKFKMDSLFQPSPNFCHLHQIKHTGGTDDGAPLMTITPRHYSDPTQPEWLQLIFTPSTGGSGGGTLDQVELAPLKGIWLDVTEQVLYANSGKYELTIKKLDGTVVMYYVNYFLDMSRGADGYHRGKWGIYRSLNAPEYLRDETVKFSDFSITSGLKYTAPAAAANLMIKALSDREVEITWTDNSDNETNFLIQRSTDGSHWFTQGIAEANETSFIDKGVDANTKYYYHVRAENWNAFSGFTEADSVTTPGQNVTLPSSWYDKDIGYINPVGYAAMDSATGNFTIEGAGKDVYGSSDEFHYVYQTLSGNGVITARVDSIMNTSEWAKAGVMIRESLDANSAHAMDVATPLHGIAMQYRPKNGGSSLSINGSAASVPYWVRLVRNGDLFTSYQSADGIVWEKVGETTIIMPVTVYAGIMVTSHNSGVLCTALFSNISVENDTTSNDKIWLEAELGNITSPMLVEESFQASGGKYIVTKQGKSTSGAPTDGHAEYQFNVKSAGTYKLWGRVIAPTHDDDSFWFKVDDNNWVSWNEVDASTDWVWAQFRDSDNGKMVVNYNLTEGTHTLTMAYREDGTLLDKILITSDTTFNPNPDSTSTAVAQGKNTLPNGYVLNNSYPNPFNPSTQISFILPKSGNVKLVIFDILGREVSTLVDGFQQAGKHEYTWNAKDDSGKNLSSGTYLARFQSGDFVKVIKLMLLK